MEGDGCGCASCLTFIRWLIGGKLCCLSLHCFPVTAAHWNRASTWHLPRRNTYTQGIDTNKSALAFPCHCMTTRLCLSRYLNGVGKNGAAPVLLELANEVMLLL